MKTIENINDQYEKKIKSVTALRQCLQDINSDRSEINRLLFSDIGTLSRSISRLDSLRKNIDCRGYAMLTDSLSVGQQFTDCSTAIDRYAEAMKNNSKMAGTINNAINRVTETQNHFAKSRDSIEEKYGYPIKTPIDISVMSSKALETAISYEEEEIEKLKNEAKEIVSREHSLDLKLSDPVKPAKRLPELMYLFRYPAYTAPTVLKDIGIYKRYQYLGADLHNKGNVLINCAFENRADRRIDQFIIAYIFRFIESFPLGSVRVHIFGQNLGSIYALLFNCFQSEEYGESVKKTIQLHIMQTDLSEFRDVTCNDVYKKIIKNNKQDLYTLYETDISEVFNLVIFRDGLVDGSGYASADTLGVINSLTKPGEIGHKCGFRFLIVDTSSSFASNFSETTKNLISTIHNNCQINLNYVKENFMASGNKTEVLTIQDDMENYIKNRSEILAKAINEAERKKGTVSIEDVSSDTVESNPENILYIPIGKSGGTIVEIPFSCKDEDGTVAGQCIGYMVIGATGVGKSSFFHSLVLNGCLKYSPEDLQFWLLDFKNGGASSKYSTCGTPHIKIIAENNKIDDALCLFQMVLEEMERRNKAFNRCFTDNILDYNKKAKAERLEYFPRIIIAIDEIQEVFREDNASVIQKLISAISSRMRSAGIHFVMVAQNLKEGKSYMLKEAFLPSATGRVCFKLNEIDIPRESGFGEDFINRRENILELNTGEAYVSYGKNTIKKVKMAYADMNSTDERKYYFDEICSRHSGYANMRPLVIGSKRRLTITDYKQGTHESYSDVIKKVKPSFGMYNAVIGEDVYRMEPLSISFSQHENSSVLFLGDNKRIASSLCASTALSLLRQNVKVHLFNADRAKDQEDFGTVPHPFMYVCQNISFSGGLLENHRLDQLKDVVRDLYSDYLGRQAEVQRAEFEDPEFSPVFLIVNDLLGIESFTSNVIVENRQKEIIDEPAKNRGFFDYDLFSDTESVNQTETGEFRENIQNIINTLLKNGYRYNMHLILAIKGDPSAWRSSHTVSDVNTIVLFNKTNYADQLENSFYLKEMLKHISGDTEETMAVWSSKKAFSKIRPIIYKMSNGAEKKALDMLLKGTHS